MNLNPFFFSSAFLCFTLVILISIILQVEDKRIKYHFLAHNLLILIWAIGATIVSQSVNHPTLSNIAYRIACTGAALVPPVFLHMVNRITKQLHNIFVLASYAIASIFVYLLLDSNEILQSVQNYHYQTFTIPKPGGLLPLWFISWIGIVSLSNALLIRNFSNNPSNQFDTKILTGCSFLGFISASMNFLVPYGIYFALYGNLGIAINCILLSRCIYKSGLFGLTIAWKEGLRYSLFLGFLTGLYLLIIMTIEGIFRGLIGYNSFTFSFISAFLFALMFNPLRDLAQRILEKITYGSEPRKIIQENMVLKDEIIQTNRLKAVATLALGVGHEIKNPLTVLKTFIDYLPEKIEDKEFLLKFSKLAKSEINRINAIIHELFQFSKPTPLRLSPVKPMQLVKEIRDLLSSDFLKTKIQISENYLDPEEIVTGDSSQLKQVLLNLFLNAVEAMPLGGIIYVYTKKEGCNYLIRIEDSGKGISPEDIREIFDPFFSTKERGSGLGLPIALQIVKAHGGKINAQSKVGSGTIFEILLPITKGG